jgi:hypothetical protein
MAPGACSKRSWDRVWRRRSADSSFDVPLPYHQTPRSRTSSGQPEAIPSSSSFLRGQAGPPRRPRPRSPYSFGSSRRPRRKRRARGDARGCGHLAVAARIIRSAPSSLTASSDVRVSGQSRRRIRTVTSVDRAAAQKSVHPSPVTALVSVQLHAGSSRDRCSNSASPQMSASQRGVGPRLARLLPRRVDRARDDARGGCVWDDGPWSSVRRSCLCAWR